MPDDFHINQIYDIHDIVQNSPTITRRPFFHEEKTEMKCDIHDDPLRVFCITCRKLICRDCTVIPRHRNHDYDLVTNIYPKQKQEIESKLKKLKERVDVTSSAMNSLTDNKREIGKQGEDVKSKIHNRAQYIVELVQQSERQLTEQVDTIVQKKCCLLDKQREEIKSVFDQLKSCEEFVEQNLKKNTPQKILSEKRSLVKNMEMVTRSTNHVILDSVEKADIAFKQQHTPVTLLQVGKIACTYFQDKCRATLTTQITPITKRKSSITLTVKTIDERPFSISSSHVSCELIYTGDNQPLPCDDIIQTTPGVYDIAFTPSNEGDYLLKVRIGDLEIGGSPFVFPVACMPELHSRSIIVIRGVSKPSSIAITKSGRIVVAVSTCIKTYNNNGQEIFSFPLKGILHGQPTDPRGVAITPDGHILVSDDHRIQKLTFNGQLVKTVGTDTHMFYTPTGIAVQPSTGKIFVADTDNHKIQVLNSDLTFSNNFGGYGSAQHQFRRPCDVALDEKGIVYVADTSNHCIKKFTSDGQYLTQFGSQGQDLGELLGPTGISVSVNGFVYVAEEDNKRISIFGCNGEFISCFGHKINDKEQFCRPKYITVDTLDNIYVSDIDKVYLFLK